MGKGSLARIAAALAIISVYIFLFGITGTIDSLADSMPNPDRNQSPKPTELTSEPPVTTTTPAETTVPTEERTVYTYATTINVRSGKKPSLADYTATEALMVVPEHSETETAAAERPDIVLDESAFRTEATTTTAPPITTTTAPATTTAASTERTAASTSILPPETTTAPAVTTTTAETAPPETTVPIEDDPDEIQDLEDDEADEPEETDEPELDDPTEDTDPDEEADEPEETPDLSWMEDPSKTSLSGEILTVNASGTPVSGDAVSIVAQAVMAEIGDGFHEEAIKAQAIATYTYLKYYNSNNQNAYVVLKTPSDNVTRCVSEVIGKAIYYDDALIQAVYCASSAGYSASAENVWGIDYPYLRSRRNEFDLLYDINYGRTETYTADEVRKLVSDNTGIVLNDDPASWFEITSHVDGAYVGSMKIGGLSSFTRNGRTTSITGRVFRETVMEFGLRSSSFEISYDTASASFTFTTYGYGHGVGMSQHGANILASQYGYTCDEILTYYYQGTTIR